MPRDKFIYWQSLAYRKAFYWGAGAEKLALKITICPKNKQFALKVTF